MRNRRNDAPLLTYEQAASYLGRSRGYLSRLIADRTVRPVRQGRDMMIRQADLDRHIRATFGNVDLYQARLARERVEALREDARRLLAEAARVVTEQRRAPSRFQQIVWRHGRRENECLRRKARERGMEGLMPQNMSDADRKKWSRILDGSSGQVRVERR